MFTDYTSHRIVWIVNGDDYTSDNGYYVKSFGFIKNIPYWSKSKFVSFNDVVWC